MRTLIGLLIAYVLAAPLTTLISFDLRLTEWTNILTYVWWAGSGIIWMMIAAFIVSIIALVSK